MFSMLLMLAEDQAISVRQAVADSIGLLPFILQEQAMPV